MSFPPQETVPKVDTNSGDTKISSTVSMGQQQYTGRVTGGCTSRRNQPALNPLFTVPVAFLFFTVYHYVDILGLNELLFSFSPVLELQHKKLITTLTGREQDGRMDGNFFRFADIPARVNVGQGFNCKKYLVHALLNTIPRVILPQDNKLVPRRQGGSEFYIFVIVPYTDIFLFLSQDVLNSNEMIHYHLYDLKTDRPPRSKHDSYIDQATLMSYWLQYIVPRDRSSSREQATISLMIPARSCRHPARDRSTGVDFARRRKGLLTKHCVKFPALILRREEQDDVPRVKIRLLNVHLLYYTCLGVFRIILCRAQVLQNWIKTVLIQGLHCQGGPMRTFEDSDLGGLKIWTQDVDSGDGNQVVQTCAVTGFHSRRGGWETL
ncbi:hypothetical protein EDD85DRAFT_794105 [Armillaria nabsnona]|nr:hypothetical protein EDD85DRAFT_794105 [Armillaria nabsnona]